MSHFDLIKSVDLLPNVSQQWQQRGYTSLWGNDLLGINYFSVCLRQRSTVSAPALLYAPVSLALISYWPFLLGFKHVLTTIFRVACLSGADSDHDTPLALEAEGAVGALRTMPVEV